MKKFISVCLSLSILNFNLLATGTVQYDDIYNSTTYTSNEDSVVIENSLNNNDNKVEYKFSNLETKGKSQTLLESGTYIPIRITENVSSNVNKKNSNKQPSAIVDSNIYSNDGKLLIKRGTPVIVNAVCKKAKGMGKEGEITLTPQSTKAIDGTEIILQGSKTFYGDNHRTDVIVCGCCFGLCILPIIGFAFFAMTGDNVEVPSDYILTNSVVNSDYYINVK